MPEPESDAASGTLARRASIVAGGTLVSRVLGFVREAVLAAVFPKEATDLFFLAFTIPNSLRMILAEGAVSAAVVPVFSEVQKAEGPDAARAYLARIGGLFGLILLAISAVGVLAAPALVSVYAAGYVGRPELFEPSVQLTRLLFPYIFFMGLTALGMGGLNAMRRFAVPALTPALLNLAMIAAAFTLVGTAVRFGYPPIGALAIGALIGGALQMVAQWPAMQSAGILGPPRFDWRHPAVKKTVSLLIPLLAGFGIYQINTALGRAIATMPWLPTGSQSYIWYGQRLVEIPQGVFGLAVGAAALPTLSDLRNAGDDARVREVFGNSLSLILFLGIPSAVGLAVFAEPIVSVAFARGQFGRAEALETAASLRWQALGVWAIAAVRTVVPMFFAYNDTRSPVMASAVNLVVFAAMAIGLSFPFQHVGIAMALSAAGIAQLFALLFLLRQRVGRLGLRRVVSRATRASIAAAAMGATLFGIAQLGRWERGGNDPMNIALLLGGVVLALVVYLAVARLVGSEDLATLTAAVRRRARR
ncbi:MAG: murein biosynthesis integral membrane protein MurJ [Sandaracinaceae bacterium]